MTEPMKESGVIMKKRSKSNNLLIVAIGIIFIFSVSVNHSEATEKSNFNEIESLSKELAAQNITVSGSNTELSHFQLSGLLDCINTEYSTIISKYDEILSATKGNISITPEDILELHYYSLTTKEQEIFLQDAKNQRVDISSKDGAILISYNSNTSAD